MSTILVIDPSATIRETVAIVLGAEHDVTTATSVADASATVAEADLVVLGLAAPPAEAARLANDLAGLPSPVPLLLLHAAADVDLRRLGDPSRRVEFLAKPFDADGLRATVRRLLVPRAGGVRGPGLAERLAVPFLAPDAALALRRALATDLPVLLVGETGSGALDVARALHACSGRRGPCVVVAGRALRAGALPAAGGGTLVVDGIHDTPAEAQHELAALARGLALDGGETSRLIAVAGAPLAAGAPTDGLLPDLGWMLATLAVPLAPLRERLDDVPALADAVAAALAPRLGLEPPRFTDAARERLRHYLWFGNLAELEAVIGRTLAWHRPHVVDAADLLFAPGPPPEAARPATPSSGDRLRVDAPAAPSRAPSPDPGAAESPGAASARPLAAEAPASPTLEVLLGELAHELRNPMSTIKTFAQHLESVLADPEVRTRFSELTAEAVTRMDRVLETLLDFARFRAPAPRALDLGTLVERVLAEQTEALAQRDVRIERNGASAGPHPVRADEAQILFALRQLFAGLASDVVPHTAVHVGINADGTLELGLRTERTTAERLAAFVEGAGAGGAETPPLYVALAGTLLQRNGGALHVRPGTETGTTVMRVALPRGGGGARDAP